MKLPKVPCDWCGKPSEVYFQGETLCDNCWQWVLLEAEKREKEANDKQQTQPEK